MLPYLPDILKAVVARVDKTFSTRSTDRFNVFFDYGIYADVSKNVYKSCAVFPLIWLVMKYAEDRGKQPEYYATTDCEIIFAMPTDASYSMQQRTDNIFKPRLLPVYEEFIRQVSLEDQLDNKDVTKIEHSKRDRPYWGGGEENNVNAKNLFQQYIEAVHIPTLKLAIKNIICTPFSNL